MRTIPKHAYGALDRGAHQLADMRRRSVVGSQTVGTIAVDLYGSTHTFRRTTTQPVRSMGKTFAKARKGSDAPMFRQGD